MRRRRLLLHETFSGGPEPAIRDDTWRSLCAEGAAMQRALLTELAGEPGLQLVVTWRADLPRPDDAGGSAQVRAGMTTPGRVEWHIPPADEAAHAVWLDRLLMGVDACWITAPESDGILYALWQRVRAQGVAWLGCVGEALAVASSKRRTAEALVRCGLPHIPTFDEAGARAWLAAHPEQTSDWVVKPDDGAGCVDTRRYTSGQIRQRLRVGQPVGTPIADCARTNGVSRGDRLIWQPWLAGMPMSLCLRRDAHGWTSLGLNRQQFQEQTTRALPTGADGGAVAVAVAMKLPHPSGLGGDFPGDRDGEAVAAGGAGASGGGAQILRSEAAGVAVVFEGCVPLPPDPGQEQELLRQMECLSAAISGWYGLLGVDFICTPDGDPVVVEINPRLTTGYAQRVLARCHASVDGARAVWRAWVRGR